MEYNIEELLVLVRELSESYTGKESTSITYEAAQQLMGAVEYCIQENDFAVESNEPVDTLVTYHRRFPTAREAYDNGYRLVIEKIKKAKEIYNDIIVDFKDYGNHAYYDTLVKGMPEFFKWYDPRLKPMNHMILIDYTVLEPLHNFEGVNLIYGYLRCIQMEQKFLQQFPEEYVREILVLLHSDYEELIINLCGVILKKVLTNMLIGVKIDKIKLEVSDYETLSDKITCTQKMVLKEELSSHLKRLITGIYSGDQELYQYLMNEIPNVVTELENAARNNCLSNII